MKKGYFFAGEWISCTKKDVKRSIRIDALKLKILKKHALKELDEINKKKYRPLSDFDKGRKRFLQFILKQKSFAGLPIEAFPDAIKEIKHQPFMEDCSPPAYYEDKEWLTAQSKKFKEREILDPIDGRYGGKKSAARKKIIAKEKHEIWQKEANDIWAKHSPFSASNVANRVAKKYKGTPYKGTPGTIRLIIKKPENR